MTDATWTGGAATTFSTAANWVENAVPTGTAFFGPSDFTEIHANGNTVGGITLNADAEDFRFYVTNFLILDGAGVTINGGSAQIDLPASSLLRFTNAASAGSASIGNDGTVGFVNTSTAGSAQITNTEVLQFSDSASAGSAALGNHSLVYFDDASSAGDATITNNAGGNISFFGTSTADTSDITNASNLTFDEGTTAGSAEIDNNSGGVLSFSGGSAGSATIINSGTVSFTSGFNGGIASAGSATITQNGGSFNFLGDSTAGNATITTKDGAHIDFQGSNTGGDAELIAELGSFFRFAADDNVMEVGSIAGAGDFVMEDTELVVGSNDLSTALSGRISQVVSSVASLIKVGTGTLTLSSVDNSYTGGTTINAGTLQVDGVILGTTTVNDGGTLGGSGTTGAVNVVSGGTLGPGASAGILSTGAIAFAAGAHFAVELGGTVPGTGYDQLAVTGTVALGGAALDLSRIGGFNPDTATTTDFLILDNDGTADAVTGTFAGLAEGDAFAAAGRFFTISYVGGDGNDVVITSSGASIEGTAGNDRVDDAGAPAGQSTATAFADTIDGKGGNDKLFGLAGNDTVIGGAGNDLLDGGLGKDAMQGGKNNDTYVVDNKRDVVDETGGGGRDLIKASVSYSLANAKYVKGTVENLTLTGSGKINGTGNDRDNAIYGNKGVNTLSGGKGKDTLKGGNGNDTLKGGDANDTLHGGKNNDKLIGGKGNDKLTGNQGADKFVFDTKLSAKGNVDTITDFQVNTDTIQLKAGLFSKIGPKLAAGEFHVGKNAQDGNDYLIHDKGSGKLYYDKNGDGTGGKVLFARLDKNLALDHNDFDMI